jgi:hypothetical protein
MRESGRRSCFDGELDVVPFACCGFDLCHKHILYFVIFRGTAGRFPDFDVFKHQYVTSSGMFK